MSAMKRLSMTTLMLVAAITAVSGPAGAQDAPKVGVTMGYPAAVGVLWNAADRFALRPEFTWSRSSNDSPATSDPLLGTITNATTSDGWQTGVGLSSLFYVGRHEKLRTYVSPRMTYSQTKSSVSVSNGPVSSSGDGWSWSTSGSFGAQYAVAPRFAVFGEVGVNYTSTTTRTSIVESRTSVVSIGAGGGIMTTSSSFTLRSDQSSHSTGLRSGAGVIFFF
jgi:hypothetical protein